MEELIKGALGLFGLFSSHNASKKAEERAERLEKEARETARWAAQNRRVQAVKDGLFLERERKIENWMLKRRLADNRREARITLGRQFTQMAGAGIDLTSSTTFNSLTETQRQFNEREFQMRYEGAITDQTIRKRTREAVRQGWVNAEYIEKGGEVRAANFASQAGVYRAKATSTLIDGLLTGFDMYNTWQDAKPKGVMASGGMGGGGK